MVNKTKRSEEWIVEEDSLEHLGTHLIAEFWGGKDITDPKEFEKVLLKAAVLAKTQPLKVFIHEFSPQGMTGVVVLAESHITFHSWPEMDYLALDVFTCGKESDPYKALDHLKKRLKPKKVEITEIKRGIL